MNSLYHKANQPAGSKLTSTEICRFLGIVIAMYYNDHEPAHFHARYGDQKARFAVESLEMTDGELGRRAKALVLEWAGLHQDELRREWELAKKRKPLFKIEPLE